MKDIIKEMKVVIEYSKSIRKIMLEETDDSIIELEYLNLELRKRIKDLEKIRNRVNSNKVLVKNNVNKYNRNR